MLHEPRTRLALFRRRGWVAFTPGGTGVGAYQLQDSIHDLCHWPCGNQPVNMPMLNGDHPILTEKQEYGPDWQQKVPSAKYFWKHAPDNMYATELKGHAQQFPGWQATAAYVFPFDSPDTRMDSESAERFLNLLRAKDRDALKTAASRLRLIRDDDEPFLPSEISTARLRNILTGFCACFRLRQPYKGFHYLGTCRIFCRMGTCPHELCARFQDGDRAVTMACLSEWTQAQEPGSISAGNVQLRATREHVPPLPPAAALCTLNFLIQRAKERSRKRVEKGAAKRKAVAALLESPSPKRKKSAENSVSFESRRSKLLQRLAQDLTSPKYQVYYRAIVNCREESVTPAEARENGLDEKLRQLLTRDKTLPVKCAAEKVIKSWAESQLLSSFLVLRFLYETGLCVHVHSYSSAFWCLEIIEEKLHR